MTPMQTTEKQQQTPAAAPGPVATEAQTQALERRSKELAQIEFGERGVVLKTYNDLWQFSSTLFRSGFAPKNCKGPEACFIIIQMGMEVGLSPMAAIQNIMCVNGIPGLHGDGQMGVVRSSKILETFDFSWEIDGKKIERLPAVFPDGLTAVFIVKRMGEKAITSTFSVADAKRAQLWGKEGPWTNYPQRMLMHRARSFALRDAFGDVLKGLRDPDELRDVIDIPADAVTVESTPNPGPLPVAAPRRSRLTQPPMLNALAQGQPSTAPVVIQGTAETVQQTPAPVATPALVQTAAPAPAPVVQPVEPTAPDFLNELRQHIQNEGFSFNAVKEAVSVLGWPVDTSVWTSWESLDQDIARRIFGSRRGIVRQLKLDEEKKAARQTVPPTA